MNETSSATEASAALLRQVGGPFVIEPIQVAAPRADEIRVRLTAVGVCHTDIACRDGFPIPLPVVLGHEGAGVVEAIGSGVTRLAVGDHVVLSFDSCGHCQACAHARPANCGHFLAHNFAGVRLVDGSTPLSQGGQPVHGNFFGQSSFASHAIAHERNAVKVASDLPLELLGPLGCGVQTGAGAVINSLALGVGESIAIFGGGAVGLSALLGARAIDAGTVVVVEPNPARRRLALELGASAALDPRAVDNVAEAIREATDGGVLHALDTTALPAVIAQAIDCIKPGGVLGMVGIPAPDAAVPASLLDLLVKSVTLRPITEGDSDPQTFVPQLLDFHRQGRFPFDRLVTRFPFAQINEAMHAAERGEVIKPVLVF